MFNGVVLYDGPSMLDGNPIVCIAVGFNRNSKNIKTGSMIQTYILRSDINPIEAIKNNSDESICGDCVHRGTGKGKKRTCYVQVFAAPYKIYKAYKNKAYPITFPYSIFERKIVRFGSYGDPAAVPLQIWDNIAKYATGHTAYTHQWEKFPEFKKYCQASVETVKQAQHAQYLGWRTFRIDLENKKQKNEVICPASKEAGKKLSCVDCQACNGISSNRKASIVIKPHGGIFVMKSFKSIQQRINT